jgi:hypothetical protein
METSKQGRKGAGRTQAGGQARPIPVWQAVQGEAWVDSANSAAGLRD